MGFLAEIFMKALAQLAAIQLFGVQPYPNFSKPNFRTRKKTILTKKQKKARVAFKRAKQARKQNKQR